MKISLITSNKKCAVEQIFLTMSQKYFWRTDVDCSVDWIVILTILPEYLIEPTTISIGG